MAKYNRPITPDDLKAINTTSGTSWVPKNPRELILPYIDQTASEEKSDIEKRREKAKKVYDGYTKIIQETKRLEDEISERCKDATVKLNRAQHLSVIEAIGRIFGEEREEITFEMYKIAVQHLAKLTDNSPVPNKKDL